MNQVVCSDEVMCYFDSCFQVMVVKLLLIQYLVVDDIIVLIIMFGLCVVVCLCDLVFKIGGMNYFLLFEGNVGDGVFVCYGSYVMELLINDLFKCGVYCKCLEVKVFGGVNVFKGFISNLVGICNVEFVCQYLQVEYILIIVEDLCGIYLCKVWFFVDSGCVVVQCLLYVYEVEVVVIEFVVCVCLLCVFVIGGVELFE